MTRAVLACLLALACGEAAAQDIGDDTMLRGAMSPFAMADGMIMPGHQVAAVFDFNPSAGSGPSMLPSALTAFASMAALVACDGEDVSGTTLTCDVGGAAPEAGGGASPTSGQAVPFTDSAARGFTIAAAGKAYEATDTDEGDVTTGDLAVETSFFASWDGAGSDVIVSKRDDGGTGNGWEIAQTSATAITFTVDAGAASQTATCTVQASTWQHVMCFVDRDSATGMRCACNGTLGTATDPTTASATLTTTDSLRVGWGGAAGSQFQGRVSYVRAWSGSGLATASYQAEASERFARLTGVYASIGGTPVAMTRAGVAWLSVDRDGDGVRRVFYVGNNWMRTDRWPETTGGEYLSGYLAEQSSTNLALQSQTIGTAPWAIIDPIDNFDGNMATAPDGTATADKIRCPVSAVSRVCGGRQPVTLTAARHTFSVYARKYDPTYFNYAVLRVNTIADTATWFNINTCAVATTGAAVITTMAEPWGVDGGGDEWCRISITYLGTAAAHDHDVILAESDNDIDFANPVNGNALSVWGAQVEATALLTQPTSYVVTVAGTATRDVDDLEFTRGLSAPYTLDCRGLLRPNAVTTGGGHALMVARTSGAQYAALYADQTQGSGRATVQNDPAIGGADATITAGSGDLTEGEIHSVRALSATNNLRLYLDGAASGTPDLSVAPAGVTRIDVGYWPDFATYSANGLIGRCRAWSAEVLP